MVFHLLRRAMPRCQLASTPRYYFHTFFDGEGVDIDFHVSAFSNYINRAVICIGLPPFDITWRTEASFPWLPFLFSLSSPPSISFFDVMSAGVFRWRSRGREFVSAGRHAHDATLIIARMMIAEYITISVSSPALKCLP